MKQFWLLSILLLAILLRVPFLNLYPVGFTADEASFGYDAYSIVKTGRDQWGHTTPLALESFGDFKAPLYSYLSIPFILALGLTKEAVRIPGALFGVASVYVLYLLTKEFLKTVNIKRNTDLFYWPLFSAFLLCISPWHIQLSRGAFEANLTSFFMPMGVLFFLKGLRNEKYFLISALVFGINLFSYHSAKIVTPLLVLFLIFIYKDRIQKNSKTFYAAGIFLLFVALTALTFFQGAGRRAADLSIYNGALEAQADRRLEAINKGMDPTLARLVHNKYFVTLDRFLYNYKSYFTADFLFKNGPRESTYGMLPGIGVLYWFEFPLLISFLWYFLKQRKEKSFLIIVFWIIVSPIPAALTMGIGNAANRTAVFMPSLSIAAALGFFYIRGFLKSKQLFVFVGVISFVSLFLFLNQYINLSPTRAAKGMLYGNMDAAFWLSQNSSDFERIIVSRSLSEPQIFIAFVNKWDPKNYQKSTQDWGRYKDQNLKFLDQLSRYSLGDYVFKSIEKDDFLLENTLIVARPEEFSKDTDPLEVVFYPDGSPSIYIVSTRQGGFAYNK